MPGKSRLQNANPTRGKIATIHQVAQLAGVSTATVSRVFSASDMVSPGLVARVQQAARALNYQPNRIARNLRTRKTSVAALIVSDIENPFFTSVMKGIERVLGEAGYTLMITNSDENEDVEWDHLMNLRAEGVRGIIFSPARADGQAYQQLVQAGMALVCIDRLPRGLKVDRVSVNNQEGVRAAVQHLVDQGHRAIGFIGGLPRASTSLDRQMGYEQAMRENGLEIHPQWVQAGSFRQEPAFQAMLAILNLPEPPTAVIAANNLMTLGALQAIYERGLRIPQDIAIVGFDDMSWAPSLNPPLTAIAQPTYELGATAAELLLSRVNDLERPYRHVILDTHLTVRMSSGPHEPGKKNENPL